jgi:hypothetical protein
VAFFTIEWDEAGEIGVLCDLSIVQTDLSDDALKKPRQKNSEESVVGGLKEKKLNVSSDSEAT